MTQRTEKENRTVTSTPADKSATVVAKALPLEGVRVLDAGQLMSGPYVASLLADFGADVIKVEQPGQGDPYRSFSPQGVDPGVGWKWISRNKKSITLNLRLERGRSLFRRLISETDILVMSFRPSTIEKYDLGYESLSKINPGLIEVLVSGFGQSGPYRDRPGFGTLAEAMTGYAHQTGEQSGPPLIPSFPLADSVAALFGAVGALCALRHREHSEAKRGQLVDVALLEGLFAILGPTASWYDRAGHIPQRTGSRSPLSAPRNAYRTRDDRYVAIAAAVQTTAKRLFTAMGRPELFEDARFNTAFSRVTNMEVLDSLVGEWVASLTQDDAIHALHKHEVPAAPILNIADLIRDPHMLEREAIVYVDDPDDGRPLAMGGVFPRLLRTPGQIKHVGEKLGASNSAVYQGILGLSDAELSELEAEGVI